MKKKYHGLFITVEGIDGCGKSTQTKLIYDYLVNKGYKAVYTREPGGTFTAEKLRGIILNPKTRIAPVTEVLLYLACRAQHIAEIIKPALDSGKIVLCERFTDSTLAYQGYARGLDLKIIRSMNNLATGGISPDLTVLLDAPVNQSLKRVNSRPKKSDRLDNETEMFHNKVRKGFLLLAKNEPGRIKIIRLESAVEKTHLKITRILNEFIGNRRPE